MMRFSKKIFATSLLSYAAIGAYSPATDEQRALVPEFDQVMKSMAAGFDYEVHESITEDEWVLTLFRIIPRKDA